MALVPQLAPSRASDASRCEGLGRPEAFPSQFRVSIRCQAKTRARNSRVRMEDGLAITSAGVPSS